MASLVGELKAHQVLLICMCAAIGTLCACAFFSTVQALSFGLITAVFTYSFLLSKAEHDNNIKFNDFDPVGPNEQIIEEPPAQPEIEAQPAEVDTDKKAVFPFSQIPFARVSVTGPADLAAALEAISSEAFSGAPADTASAPPPPPPSGNSQTKEPGSSYRRRLAKCWKCGDEMYFYTWPGHQRLHVDQPPAPLPDSLQLKWSLAENAKHWSNTCLHCGTAQTDDDVFDVNALTDWQNF